MIIDRWIITRLDSYGLKTVDELPKFDRSKYVIGTPLRARVFKSKQEALDFIKTLGKGEYQVFKFDGSVEVIEHIELKTVFMFPDKSTTFDSKEWTGNNEAKD